MSTRCEYCGQSVPDGAQSCPNCGAPVYRRPDGAGIPQTIDELYDFCTLHKLPLTQMRFFIGEDYRQPKAFGIYQDESGDFVVYKNKSDGTRAVRYQGPDEACAVREIYERMRAEIANQRSRMASEGLKTSGASAQAQPKKRKGFHISRTTAYIILFIVVVACNNLIRNVQARFRNRNNGYYVYQEDTYYRQGDDWYLYDDNLFYWIPTAVDEALANHSRSYYEGSAWSESYGVEDFSDSAYYVDPSDYSSQSSDSWDDDNDWDWDSDYDSWDSDSTDWDSDW